MEYIWYAALVQALLSQVGKGLCILHMRRGSWFTHHWRRARRLILKILCGGCSISMERSMLPPAGCSKRLRCVHNIWYVILFYFGCLRIVISGDSGDIVTNTRNNLEMSIIGKWKNLHFQVIPGIFHQIPGITWKSKILAFPKILISKLFLVFFIEYHE